MTEENSEPEQEGDDVPKEGQEENVKKTPTAIEAAAALADRIDAGNKKAEEILERQEKLHAEQMLGGTSTAGQEPEKPKELTDEEYKDKVMGGEVPKKNG